jgi:signal transduction histidine kinase
LSRGIKKLFPSEHTELARDGGLFLSKIFEKDREHFHKELNTNGKIPETFSFTYRVSIPPSDQIIYLLDVRTPIITATNKLLGYDGVFVDITRQAIAEHRLSSSVWREGLATLTNGLVHDFSNLMAGIYSISELYHGMMEKDDPMVKGMGQIKKSAMQAQKLVRRIIDLHREKAASRTVHDLRLLLKDQMDLVDIIIPRSAKISTDFSNESMPAFIEERGKKSAPAEGAELSLTDNGKGIPKDLRQSLFDPFVTTKASGSGSGFGLYNTKVFIEDHNGLIGFTSELGKGTTFYLFVPLEYYEEDKPSQSVKRAKRATRAFIKTRKI